MALVAAAALGAGGALGWALWAKQRPRPRPRLDADAWRALCAASRAPLPHGPRPLAKMRQIVMQGGVVDAVRPLAWPILFGLDPGDEDIEASGTQHAAASSAGGGWRRRRALQERRRERYLSLVAEVNEALGGSGPQAEGPLGEAARVLDIDLQRMSDAVSMRPELRRIVLAHVAWDPALGYCQGMAEVAAPFLGVLRQFGDVDTLGDVMGNGDDGDGGARVTLAESEAFWLYEAVLKNHLGGNFRDGFRGVWRQLGHLRRLCTRHDPALTRAVVLSSSSRGEEERAGMGEVAARVHAEPFLFCFRALLLGFRRELSRDAFLVLLEAQAADPEPGRAATLACRFAAAVLMQQRASLMAHDGSELGRDEACYGLFRDAERAISFWPALARAQAILAQNALY